MHRCTCTALRTVIVPDKRNPLNEGEIGRISLGDTRHMALINLVMSGASLQACKELAGHHHIVTASHYYSNITSMLDALSLTQQYKQSLWLSLLSGDTAD